MKGERFGKENSNPQPSSCHQQSSSGFSRNVVNPNVFGSLFSGLSNGNITLSFQNLVVNIGTYFCII